MRRYSRHFWVLCLLALLIPAIMQTATPVQAQTVPNVPAVTVKVTRTNLWAGPGRGFWVLGTLVRNEAVPVIGVSADKQWWQVKTTIGEGFVNADEVDASNVANVPVANIGTYGRLVAGIAIVRTDPGFEARQYGTIARGMQFYVIGARPDGEWIQIHYRWGKGWIKTSLTSITNDMLASLGVGSVDVPVTVGDPTAIVNTGWLNVRSGPSSIYSSLGKAPGGTRMKIVGRTEDGLWLKVESPFGTGWVKITFIITVNYFGSVPVSGASATSQTYAQLKVLGGTANIRSGPGLGFDVVFKANAGTIVKIIGQSRTGWWYVEGSNGKGWINKSLGQASGDVAGVPFQQ